MTAQEQEGFTQAHYLDGGLYALGATTIVQGVTLTNKLWGSWNNVAYMVDAGFEAWNQIGPLDGVPIYGYAWYRFANKYKARVHAIEVSNDGSNFTALDQYTSHANPADGMDFFDWRAHPKNYKYYRHRISPVHPSPEWAVVPPVILLTK